METADLVWRTVSLSRLNWVHSLHTSQPLRNRAGFLANPGPMATSCQSTGAVLFLIRVEPLGCVARRRHW